MVTKEGRINPQKILSITKYLNTASNFKKNYLEHESLKEKYDWHPLVVTNLLIMSFSNAYWDAFIGWDVVGIADPANMFCIADKATCEW